MPKRTKRLLRSVRALVVVFALGLHLGCGDVVVVPVTPTRPVVHEDSGSLDTVGSGSSGSHDTVGSGSSASEHAGSGSGSSVPFEQGSGPFDP